MYTKKWYLLFFLDDCLLSWFFTRLYLVAPSTKHKYRRVAPNICGPSAWNLLHAILLRRLEF